MRYPKLNKDQLAARFKNRGTDYDRLEYEHNLHKDFENKIVKTFKDFGCEVMVTNR